MIAVAIILAALTLASTARASAPYTGIDSWYGYWSNINEQTIVDMTNAASTDGLYKAGYRYVWIEAGWWMGARNADGIIQLDPSQWPHGMAWLASYIHSKGFLAGIYEESGDTACHNGGALGHVQQDINTFAAWGFDGLKVDYCGDEARLHRDPAHVFGEFATAIANDQPHRSILLNACDADTWDAFPLTSYAAWQWGPEVATAWRTGTDLSWPGGISWKHLLRNIDADAMHPEVAGNGHWNDPDYLVPTLLPPTQARTQFSMWAMLAAPMMVSANLSTLSASMLAMLTNRRALAISQDPLGIQARAVAHRGQLEVWTKPLADRSVAVAIQNRGTKTAKIRLTPQALGFNTERLSIVHVWSGARATVREIRASIRGTATMLLRVRPTR